MSSSALSAVYRRGAPSSLHVGEARRLYVVDAAGLVVVIDADRVDLEAGDLHPLLTEAEACAWLGVDVPTLWALLGAGRVRGHHLPSDADDGTLRLDTAATLELLAPFLSAPPPAAVAV